MSRLTPQLDAALSAERALIAGAIEINLPDHDIRLIDGSGVVSFDGNSFSGSDPIYGVLDSIEDLTEGTGDEVPALSISFQPSSDAAASSLLGADKHGARVRLWLLAVDRATGSVIPDPELLFDGEIDVPTLKLGMKGRSIDFDCVPASERLFELEEGNRLSPAFHHSIWPGELGMDHATGVTDIVYWGSYAPAGVSYS